MHYKREETLLLEYLGPNPTLRIIKSESILVLSISLQPVALRIEVAAATHASKESEVKLG